MNTAELNRFAEPWNATASSREENANSYGMSEYAIEDQVAWPPVIARIRDLDKPAVPEKPLPVSAPVPPKQTAKKTAPAKNMDPRRKSPYFSSRLIALAGIVIFFCAIIPFMHFGDDQSGTETIDTVFQQPPATNSGLNDTFNNIAVNSAEKSASSTPVAATPTSPSGNSAALPPAPLLAPQPEKQGFPECLVKSNSGDKNSPQVTTSAEQFAGPSGTIRPAVPSQSNIPANTTPTIPANNDPTSLPTMVLGESEPLRDYNPESTPPTNIPSGLQRTAPEISAHPSPNGTNFTPAVPHAPMLSGGVPQDMTGVPQANPNIPSPFAPPPTASGAGLDNRGIQQADLRNRVPYPEPYPTNNGNYPTNTVLPPNNLDALPLNKQPLQYNGQPQPQPQNTPNYPPPGQAYPQNGQALPQYGQPLPQNGQALSNPTRPNLPSGEQLPTYHLANSMQRNSVTQPARSPYPPNPYPNNQTAQYPVPTSAYQNNQYPVPTSAYQTAGAMQSGYPATQPANPYARTAASYNNTNNGNANGYSIPPVTENSSPRY